MNILVVDDHPFMRLGLRAAICRAAPASVCSEAASGEEALVACETLQPRLVVSDVAMPGPVDGIELARQLRARHPATAVLIVTAHDDPRTVRAALRAGAAGCAAKTSAPDQIGLAVRSVLAGRTFLCPSCAEAFRQATGCGDGSVAETEVDVLSAREREVLALISTGDTTRSITQRLGISPKTVETHRLNIMRRRQIDNVVSLTRYALQRGLSRL